MTTAGSEIEARPCRADARTTRRAHAHNPGGDPPARERPGQAVDPHPGAPGRSDRDAAVDFLRAGAGRRRAESRRTGHLENPNAIAPRLVLSQTRGNKVVEDPIRQN